MPSPIPGTRATLLGMLALAGAMGGSDLPGLRPVRDPREDDDDIELDPTRVPVRRQGREIAAVHREQARRDKKAAALPKRCPRCQKRETHPTGRLDDSNRPLHQCERVGCMHTFPDKS